MTWQLSVLLGRFTRALYSKLASDSGFFGKHQTVTTKEECAIIHNQTCLSQVNRPWFVPKLRDSKTVKCGIDLFSQSL